MLLIPLLAPAPHNHHHCRAFAHAVFYAWGFFNSNTHTPLVTSHLPFISHLRRHLLKPRSCSFIRHLHRIMLWVHVSQICNRTPSFSQQPFTEHLLSARHRSRHLRSIKELHRQKSRFSCSLHAMTNSMNNYKFISVLIFLTSFPHWTLCSTRARIVSVFADEYHHPSARC